MGQSASETIEYHFSLDKGEETVITIEFDPETLTIKNRLAQKPPAWTALEFHQCSHCPLSKKESPQCPVALSLVPIVEDFDQILSYEELDVEVITEHRTVHKRTSVQEALSSLVGLIIGTSGCPHTAFFRSMAHYHLPLASQEETIWRAASAYLLSQYLLKQKGSDAEFDFTGLDQIYANMNIINIAIAKRMRSATKSDSTVNAVVVLDMHAHTVPVAIGDFLEQMQYLFKPYFDQLQSK